MKGGSAVLWNSRNVNIDGCKFLDNYVSDSVCKIITSFKSKKDSLSSISNIKSESQLIIFNECRFKADSESLINFTIGNGGSNVEVQSVNKDCLVGK